MKLLLSLGLACLGNLENGAQAKDQIPLPPSMTARGATLGNSNFSSIDTNVGTGTNTSITTITKTGTTTPTSSNTASSTVSTPTASAINTATPNSNALTAATTSSSPSGSSSPVSCRAPKMDLGPGGSLNPSGINWPDSIVCHSIGSSSPNIVPLPYTFTLVGMTLSVGSSQFSYAVMYQMDSIDPNSITSVETAGYSRGGPTGNTVTATFKQPILFFGYTTGNSEKRNNYPNPSLHMPLDKSCFENSIQQFISDGAIYNCGSH